MIARYNVQGTTRVAMGVNVTGDDKSGAHAAFRAIDAADAVVLALGTDTLAVEHEGHDRESVTLPLDSAQVWFALNILQRANATNTPVTLVLVNGGSVSVDDLDRMGPIHAMVEAFFPGPRGAEAVARHLLGVDNRWGRLPYSIMTSNFGEAYALADYRMSFRTYRYAQPMFISFPFGFGLSYTQFSLSRPIATEQGAAVQLSVKNVGGRQGDVVLMAYFRPLQLESKHAFTAASALHRQLFAFRRLALERGAMADVTIPVSAADLALFDDGGVRRTVDGVFSLVFSTGAAESGDVALTVKIVNGQLAPAQQ
mmetsp:Transcript_53597/g.116472  ORF Transcript_53597/g.116472 Transcript_53597/m.116472 type:complete len:312 (+) Transcript_53597:358-1293(+)